MTSRRACLKSLGGSLAALAASRSAPAAFAAETVSKAEPSNLAMPGLHRGRVVAVESPAVIVEGAYQPETVQRMMRRGMTELTGAGDWVEAWKRFFAPGDVVGIKVNPVGAPRVISDASVVREIIAGLEAAGVKRQDIVVYDRDREQFLRGGFDKSRPEGVRGAQAAE